MWIFYYELVVPNYKIKIIQSPFQSMGSVVNYNFNFCCAADISVSYPFYFNDYYWFYCIYCDFLLWTVSLNTIMHDYSKSLAVEDDNIRNFMFLTKQHLATTLLEIWFKRIMLFISLFFFIGTVV